MLSKAQFTLLLIIIIIVMVESIMYAITLLMNAIEQSIKSFTIRVIVVFNTQAFIVHHLASIITIKTLLKRLRVETVPYYSSCFRFLTKLNYLHEIK